MNWKLILPLVSCTILAGGVAACNKNAETPAATETFSINGPETKTGLSGSNGQLVLPIVKGRPAAVYVTVRNDGPSPVTLAAAHVQDADKAEIHETVGNSMNPVNTLPITPGASVMFAPGGLHIMAFNLKETVKSGDTVELTLTFSDGDKLTVPLQVISRMENDAADHSIHGEHP